VLARNGNAPNLITIKMMSENKEPANVFEYNA
jgi:hypothetical protein